MGSSSDRNPKTGRLSRWSQHNRVYFVEGVGTGLIKIGFASNVDRRLSDLRASSPVPLLLLATEWGGQPEEIAYHRQFAAQRVRGEWFTRCPDLDAVIYCADQPREILDLPKLYGRRLDAALDEIRLGRAIRPAGVNLGSAMRRSYVPLGRSP